MWETFNSLGNFNALVTITDSFKSSVKLPGAGWGPVGCFIRLFMEGFPK